MHQQILDDLIASANPETALKSQRFFKTGEGEYGANDKFLGLKVPLLREKVKLYKAATIEDSLQLLTSEYHEVRLFALFMLVFRYQKGDEQAKDQIYSSYLNHTQYINNWDLVDSSAYQIVGHFLQNKSKETLFELAESADLWQRRIAMVACFQFIRQKIHFDITLSLAEKLLNDKEDLIHKAVGWMLRELGKKDKEQQVVFLNIHYQQMPRTMLRYAIEKFTKEERQSYLKGEI